MTAELGGFDMNYMKRLKTIEGQQNILGCEKVHVLAYYDQTTVPPIMLCIMGMLG